VSDPNPENDTPPAAGDEVPADEDYARAYAAGFGEGIRSGLREILQHTARGHTAQEIRILAESRLARLSEEIELKRKSLLAPPRRPAWTSLLRAPQPTRPWVAPVAGAIPAVRLRPGASVLVREERPTRALEYLRASAPAFPRTVLVSTRPPELVPPPSSERIAITLGGAGTADARDAERLTPGEIGGRIREPTESPGGALVYLDALEYLSTENSFEQTLRFVHWLVTQTKETGSALVVSFDRRSIDLKDMSRLEHAFDTVI
jgi:hypothetical protein